MNEQLLLAFEALDFIKNRKMQTVSRFMHPRHTIGNQVYEAAHNAVIERLGNFRRDFGESLDLLRDPAQAAIYGRCALSHRLGNCYESACAGAWYLDQQGSKNHAVIQFSDGDHAIVVMSQPADERGEYPGSFTSWKPTAVVLDPWADIACLAQEYPARWRARMSNWQIMGMAVTQSLPTSPRIYNMVDGRKTRVLSWD